MKKKLLCLLLAIFCAFSMSGCDSAEDSSKEENLTNDKAAEESKQNDSKYKLGETFSFDGFDITFDTTYSFVTLDNEFAEENGQSVIKIGATVKNTTDETKSLNMFYYSLFGSKGTELDSVTAYFDESIDFAGDLRPDASYKKYFYIYMMAMAIMELILTIILTKKLWSLRLQNKVILNHLFWCFIRVIILFFSYSIMEG